MKNRLCRKVTVLVLAAAMAASVTACGSTETDQTSAGEEESVIKAAEEYDTDRTLEEIIASIEDEIAAISEDLTEEWNEIFSDASLTADPDALTEAVETWHAAAMEQSQPLYESVLDDVVSYCLVVAATMSDSASYYITSTMGDVASAAFEDGLYAYEDTVCGEGLYNEIYDTYYKELSEEDTEDYEAWNASYEAFYDLMTEFIEDWETNRDVINVTYHAFDDDFDKGIFDEETLFEDLDYRLAAVGE